MSTTGTTPERRLDPPHVGCTGALILVLLASGAGIWAGTHWHASLARLLGNGEKTPAGTDDHAPPQLWTCSMHPSVLRDAPGLCPICHMALTPVRALAAARTENAGGERAVRYWWDPMMDPPFISNQPGKSPMGMDLIPVYEPGEQGDPNVVTIDPAIVQNMGVRVAKAEAGPLLRTIRAVGILAEAEPAFQDVNLRVSGWIERLHADYVGKHVEAGEPLFDLYSPDVQVAVEELIAARRARDRLAGNAQPGNPAETLFQTATKKLELYGFERPQVLALAALDAAPRTIPFPSPIRGDIVEKDVVVGASVKAGDRVMRLVDRTLLWLDARVFEQHLPFVAVGQHVHATVPALPGEGFGGEVFYVSPDLDPVTRTATVRIAIPDPKRRLKPGTYGTMLLEVELAARAILIPREAVIDTGERQIVFLTRGVGHFEPREVVVGLDADGGRVQVREGLAPGDVVVTSGQFLLDTESRLQEAVAKFLSKDATVATVIGPGAATPSPATVPPDVTRAIDRVVEAYLAVVRRLGAVQEDDAPVDEAPLVAAAHELADTAAGTAVEAEAQALAAAAGRMRGLGIDHQRERFKQASDALIALVGRAPPSSRVGEALYVMYCPMAPGSWIQDQEELRNPYYAHDMKACGGVVRTVAAAGRTGADEDGR